MSLTVEDVRALWAAAADRALAAPGTTLADVLDTIGPREDPSIADCIAMLTAPSALPGCALEAFDVREDVPSLAPAQIIQLPAQMLRAAHA
ncbi:hypothetical protein [Sphingomonas sp. KR3-1]|uniref:hypothetical protein n=1 Tax=Sphingomonas sp. KR3-1 TaxID=3156611 RepID=UPI0032B44C1F